MAFGRASCWAHDAYAAWPDKEQRPAARVMLSVLLADLEVPIFSRAAPVEVNTPPPVLPIRQAHAAAGSNARPRRHEEQAAVCVRA